MVGLSSVFIPTTRCLSLVADILGIETLETNGLDSVLETARQTERGALISSRDGLVECATSDPASYYSWVKLGKTALRPARFETRPGYCGRAFSRELEIHRGLAYQLTMC